MGQKLNNGTTEVNVTDNDGLGGLSIRLAQPARVSNIANTARYRFEVYAETDEGNYPVGNFASCPPGRRLARVLAMANCPGARNWKLVISLVRGTTYDGAEISLSVGRPSGEPGVIRIAERFKYYAAAAPAVVPILTGETVLGWTVAAGAGGATVVIGTGATITVPILGSMSGGGGSLIDGPIDFTIATDVTSYLIEVAESA